AIDHDSNVRIVHVSNKAQLGAPVAIAADLRVGDHTYGGGELRVTNAGDKPILTLRGAWIITLSSGRVTEQRWNVGGVTSIWFGGRNPGAEDEIPVAGPPNNITSGQETIKHVKAQLKGVVFADRTYWGDEGTTVMQDLRTEAQAFLMVAVKVREMYQGSKSNELVRQMVTPSSDPAAGIFPNAKYSSTFRLTLMKNGVLRADAGQWMDRIVESLKQFLV
ncbi:MAG: hypothetical protein ACREDR_27730, partial [Blastocatellia bacterium]